MLGRLFSSVVGVCLWDVSPVPILCRGDPQGPGRHSHHVTKPAHASLHCHQKNPRKGPLFILGDFNARVGVDHNSWPICLGQFCTGKINENGQRLLEFCCHHGLCISNIFFNMKPQRIVSWRHPRFKNWHQLDLILTKRSCLPSIKLTRSYQSAYCDIDLS